MLLAALAALAAAAGFRAVFIHRMPAFARRLLFHVCVVAAATLLLEAVVAPIAGLAPWLMGAWFAVLAGMYAGHAFAMRNWGSPMSRAVLLFGLRRVHGLAGVRPLLAIGIVPGLGAAFAIGWTSARWAMPPEPSLPANVAAAAVLLVAAAAAGRAGRVSARSDLLIGLVLGGHGPQALPPPEDPALGARWPVAPIAAPVRPRTVAIFVVDSLRAHNMSAYGYERETTPFLRSLVESRGAAAVPLAVSSSASSESALWSILSSRRARHLAVNAQCLHDVLRRAGFTVRFFLSGAHRNWMGLEYLYGSDVDGLVDQLVDDEIVERVRRLPAGRTGGGDFLFFHLMSVHTASGRESRQVWVPARNRFAFAESAAIDGASRHALRNHYDNGVLQADECIAAVVDVLSTKGLLDDALVIVTSDHGEALADRIPTVIGHGRNLYQESIHVPLIVWDTTRPVAAATYLADHTDVAPTVAEALELVVPPSWQGASVLSGPARRTAHVEHIAHRSEKMPTHMEALLAALPSGVYKAMRYRQSSADALRQTFCLSTDPGETRDVTTDLSDDVRDALERALADYHDLPAIAPSTTWRYLYDPA